MTHREMLRFNFVLGCLDYNSTMNRFWVLARIFLLSFTTLKKTRRFSVLKLVSTFVAGLLELQFSKVA
jgi:hypothetical protein